MKKKTTIYDIAKELNVTVSTVSRALSGFPSISNATRQAVLEAARRLNYSPNKLASALKSGRTYTIGVIVPSVQPQFFATIIHTIEEELKDRGYRIILYQSNESSTSEINGVRTLLEAQVDGIIASLSLETRDTTHFADMIAQQKPLVLFDRVDHGLKVPTVTLDDFQAGYLATAHLIEQGYRSISYITTIHQIPIFSERMKGYKAALVDHNLRYREEHVIFGGLSIADGRLGAQKLLKSAERPDAIIAADDFTALGVIKLLEEKQLTPPKIGVVGFANETFSAYITPGLTSVDQHPDQIGRACASLFLEQLKTNTSPKHSNLVISPSLVIRNSTKR